MSNVIQALEDEVKSIGKAIERYRKKEYPEDAIVALMKLQAKVEHSLTDLKAGIDLHLMCNGCGLVLPACEFGFSTTVQECGECDTHIKIEVTCPKCNITRTVYKDRQYED